MMTHESVPINPPRSLTPAERGILDRLLSAVFQGQVELLRQAQSAHVSEECRDCRSIKLIVDQLPDNLAKVKQRIPIEAEAADLDGAKIHILLHVVRGYMDEIEIYREDLREVKKIPEPDSLELISLGDSY